MSTIRLRLTILFDRLVASLVGRRCAACRAPTALPLCVDCMDDLLALPPAQSAAFRDDGAAARVVRLAKRGDLRGGGALLAHLVLYDRAWLVPDCDVVTWVPPDRRRRARRGGHLPERFARALAERLGVPALPLLEPARRQRRPQRGLDRDARQANVADAFRMRRQRRGVQPPSGLRVLVVDDVRTTGATLGAALDALAAAGLEGRGFAIVGVDNTESGRRRCLESSLGAREIGSRS